MNLPKINKKICEDIIWIIGPQRSGTSITGKIIGSLKDIEYFYEPELIFSLLPAIKKIDKKIWSIIFETYVVEDLLFNSLSGRKINLKKFEESYIENYQTKKNILERLNSKFRKKNFGKKIKKIKIVIKVPDCIKYFIDYQKIYKKNKFIIITRDVFENLKSLVKKNWYNNLGSSNEIYPYIIEKENFYPVWISDKDKNFWKNLNKYEKAAFYLIENYRHQKKIKNKIFISYESLINNPKQVSNFLKKKLKTQETILTKKNIKLIKKKAKQNKKYIFFLKNKINQKIFDKLLNINKELASF